MKRQTSILVVEDDQNVALAIETLLIKNFPDFNIVKVSSCRMAMESLQSEHYSLVISDWNMPSRTGVDLLNDIRQSNRTRHIPFLMVTARSDKPSVVTAIQKGANDYICKPFEKQALLTKVSRLLGISPQAITTTLQSSDEPAASQDINPIEAITQRLKSGNLGSLMLPNVAMKIQEIINSGNASVDMICDAVRLDPALTSKLIGIANSPYYLRSAKCATLRDAIVRIGSREASHCTMALTTKELFSSHLPQLDDILRKQWEHALATGYCAEQIARKIALSSSEDYFTMGLLHDIGKLLLLSILQDLARNRALPSQEEIDEILTLHHAVFGAELLKRWNFPLPFIEIAFFHHDMDYLRQCAKGLLVVGFANLLVHKIGDSSDPFDDPDLTAFGVMLNLQPEDMKPILADVEQYVQHVF